MLRSSTNKHQKVLPATEQNSVKLIQFLSGYSSIKVIFLEFLPDIIFSTEGKLHTKGFGTYEQLNQKITKAIAL